MTRVQAGIQAVQLELGRTGEDPIPANEIEEIAGYLAEISEELPLASGHDVACYLLYPQPTVLRYGLPYQPDG